MNLEDFQGYLANLLAECRDFRQEGLRIYDPENPQDGTGIFLDDGSFPKIPGIEAALRERGLIFAVSMPSLDDVEETSPNGLAKLRALVHVGIAENVKVNRGAKGTRIPLMKALRLVNEVVTGKPKSPTGGEWYFRSKRNVLHDMQDGVLEATVVFERPMLFFPTHE